MKKYNLYKDSGIDWLGEIPEHWKVCRMKNLGFLYSGLSGKSGNDFEKEPKKTYKPFINFTNVANNKFIQSDNFGYVFLNEGEKQNRVSKGDLFFLMSSENQEDVGKSALLIDEYEELYLNSFCKGFRFTESQVDPSFISYLLSSNVLSQLISIEGRGFTRINLRMEGIQNLPVIFPELNEQIKISNYLDKKTILIDELIIKKKRLIQLLKEERKTIINHSVTKGVNSNVQMKSSHVQWLGKIPVHWGVKRTKYLFDIRKKIAGKLGYDVLSVTQKGIKIKDITSGDGQLSMDYSKYQLVKKGQFVMNHMDLLTGFVDKSKYEGVTSPDYRVFESISKESESDYYLYLYQMFYNEKLLFPYGRGSAQVGRWRLPTIEFKNFRLPVPPIGEQEEIVDFIKTKHNEIDKTLSVLKKEIKYLNEYKTTLISEVVTGKIDVREEVLN